MFNIRSGCYSDLENRASILPLYSRRHSSNYEFIFLANGNMSSSYDKTNSTSLSNFLHQSFFSTFNDTHYIEFNKRLRYGERRLSIFSSSSSEKFAMVAGLVAHFIHPDRLLPMRVSDVFIDLTLSNLSFSFFLNNLRNFSRASLQPLIHFSLIHAPRKVLRLHS